MWTPIRKATPDDIERVNERAIAFMARHGMSINPMPALTNLGSEIYAIKESDPSRAKYLERLWHRIVERATNEPGATGIAYGHIGY